MELEANTKGGEGRVKRGEMSRDAHNGLWVLRWWDNLGGYTQRENNDVRKKSE